MGNLVYPIIYKVLYAFQVVFQISEPSTVPSALEVQVHRSRSPGSTEILQNCFSDPGLVQGSHRWMLGTVVVGIGKMMKKWGILRFHASKLFRETPKEVCRFGYVGAG